MYNSLLRTNKEIVDIYNRHFDTIYRVCYLYMKNKNDTEDMVQETFLKLYKTTKVFESIEHEKAFLIVVASNLCKNNIKRFFNRFTGINNIELTDNNKKDETLELVLNLPTKYKTVIYLYYYDGYSTLEIAKMLNINESTIRSQLHYGRKLLKEIIGVENEK